MKLLFCFFFVVICLPQVLLADIHVTPALTEATVYRSGAKLSSMATVRVPAGASEVVFDNLSPYFNAQSLQVKIKGGATLNSAVFRLNTPGPGPESPRAPFLRDSLIMLGDEFVKLRDERDILVQEEAFLLENAHKLGTTTTTNGVTTSGVTIDDLKNWAAYSRQRQLEIKARLLDLVGKERKLNELYRKIQETLNRLQPNVGNSTGEITLKLDAPAAQSVEITCTYLITEAGWTPLYDLHATGLDQSLHLVYKANVSNRSGFHWKDVKLHLSSAMPLANNERPVLHPVFIDYRTYAQVQYWSQPQTVQYQLAEANMALDVVKEKAEDDLARAGKPGAPIPVLAPEPEEAEDLPVTQFDLPKPQDILADGQDNIVTVEESDIPASYEYHTVPKMEAAVFLLAKITDYGKFNLLPGTANLFYQETFIGQAGVNPNVTADTMLLSLGRDEQIAVKRIQPKDLTDKKKIFDKNIRETYTYEITVKNNKTVPVTVKVLDQIPVSKQEDIKVELEEKSGADYKADYGKLEWTLDIPPGQSKKVKFTYSVKYPKDKQVGVVRG